VAASSGTRQFRLRVGGRNEAGVLRGLSQVIARCGIDITGMHAVRTEEGHAFEMILRLALPNNFNHEQLLQEIEAIGRPLGVTADLKPAV
jgi:(p)ppGpp synthase/HD superfamily hydrolase